MKTNANQSDEDKRQAESKPSGGLKNLLMPALLGLASGVTLLILEYNSGFFQKVPQQDSASTVSLPTYLAIITGSIGLVLLVISSCASGWDNGSDSARNTRSLSQQHA